MTNDMMRDLRTALPSLRPSERRVADLVLSEPATAVDYTITDIAERCETSVASVVRFCRTLGFSGYSDFRLALASSVGRAQVSLKTFGVSDSDIATDDDAKAVIAKLAFHEARDIEATASALDTATLDRVANAIVAAPRVDLYGSASSGLVAADMQQKLHRVGLISYAWSDVHLALTSAAVLHDGCVAIGFSHSGQTTETADSLSAAHRRGATTVLVTNFPNSPLARQADHVLATSVTETRYRPGAMSGRIAQLAVVDFIFVRVAQQISERMSEPLELTYDAVQAHRLNYNRSRSGE